MKAQSITRYDPNAPRDYSTLKIGPHTVLRMPLKGTPFTRYCVLDKGTIVGAQISYPSASDCEGYKRRAKNAAAARASSHAATSEPAVELDVKGSLTDRILTALRAEKMGLPKLATALGAEQTLLSPIITRLVKKGRILRRGAIRKYVYEVA